ncbi:MAG TPA: divalent-cation tolerance protein CutA [Candidatus Brocadiia bacterium]|nr:divalent-cation tolerance protein CutA [Candidatus Brocadiia bacterium]
MTNETRPRGEAPDAPGQGGEALIVLVTAAGEAEAAALGRAVVEERLAACCTILPGARSIYRWEGRVCEGAEAVLILKTTAERFEPLASRLRSLHSYETPEIIAAPVVAGSEAYLRWVRESCSPA